MFPFLFAVELDNPFDSQEKGKHCLSVGSERHQQCPKDLFLDHIFVLSFDLLTDHTEVVLRFIVVAKSAVT